MITLSNPRYNKAAQLHRNGKTDEAISELNLAISETPADIKPFLSLAAIYEERGQAQTAVDLYRKALQINLDDPVANLRLGILLTSMGSYNAALTPLRMAWSNDKKNSRAAVALAEALDAAGDYATAHVMYDEAVKLDPGLLNAYYNLGTLCYNEGKFEASINHFMTYMVKAGENSRAHRNIGKALVRLGHHQNAIKSFDKAAKLDPNDPTICYNLALVYNLLNNAQAAFVNFQQALKLYPNYTEARYTYAKALLLSGQIPQAMSEFLIVAQQCPDHYRALNGLATCYLKNGDNDNAATILRQAVEIAPDFAFVHYNLGIALRGLGFDYESAHHFQEAARLDQGDQLSLRSSTATPQIANPSRIVGPNMSRRLSA